MNSKGNMHKRIKQVTAWILMAVMGVNSFGGQITSSISTVYATDYERASEEAEEEIRAAEQAAGIGTGNEGVENETVGQEEETSPMEDTPESKTEAAVAEKEQVLYEVKTISSDTTLTEDLEVGDLQVNAALHLNGHKVVVHGNVTLNSYLYMEEGYLVTEGDFQENYWAQLSMETLNDYIQIEGDYIYANSYRYSRKMNKGTIEIHGGIKGTSNNYCGTSVIFDAGCKVLMLGNSEQIIDIRTDSGLVIKHLVIENTSEEGVLSRHMLASESIEDSGKKLHYVREGETGTTLTEDMVVAGDYCLLDGTLDLAGHNLTIQGDLIHAGGILQVNGGSLTIEGDYRRQLVYEENGVEIEDYSIGRLVMDQEPDYVLIKGDYVDSGLKATETDLTAGTLELQGSMRANDSLRHPLFQSAGTHTVKLSGAGKQLLQTGNSYTGDCLYFRNLVIAQPEGGSAEWASAIIVTGSVSHESANITGLTRIEGAVINSPDLYGDVQIKNNYQFQSDLVIHGNLYMGISSSYYYHRTVSFNNCHVTVKGSYYHTNVTLNSTGENAVFTVENDFVMSGGSGNTASVSVVEVGGSITKTGYTYLSCGENTEVRFIGEKQQKIEISNDSSLFTNVVVDNPEGVVVEDNIAVINVSCKQGVLSYASGGVHGFTVEEDGEYEGDLVIGGGILDLNGHSYHVKGNLTVANGALNMSHAEDYLLVDGDFTTDSTINHSGKLTDGVLEIKGNFAQRGGTQAFTATNSHTVIFSGEKQQQISFNSPAASYFCNLKMANAAGVVLSTNVKAVGKVEQTGIVDGYLGISSTTTFAENSYLGNVKTIEETKLSENCKIDGQLLISSDFHLNGKEMEVTGKVTVTNACYFERGHLTCESFEMQNCYRIYMQYEEDELSVQKDFIVYSRYNYFYKGHISVGGDITFSDGSANCFDENVELEMNGTGKQTVTMSGSNRYFGTLILNNTSEEGVCVTNDLNFKKLVNTSGTKVTFSNGGVLGYTLCQDEVVEGDFLLSGGSMDLNGYTLTVKGDFLQSGGSLNINGGTLLVEGNYCLAKRTETEEGTYTYGNTSGKLYMNNAEDSITIKGDMYTAVSDINSWSCSAGTIKLAGNLTLSNATYLYFKKDVMLVLDGNEKQQFSFTNGYMWLGGLLLDNTEGVTFTSGQHILIRGDLTTNAYPVDGWLDIYAGAVLKDDVIKGNLYFYENYSLDKDLLVKGEVNIYRLSLNGYHLTVDGDCRLNSSNINQSNGILEVKGDLLYAGGVYLGSGTNQVILSGDEKQTIQANNFNWKFNELVIENTSDEGVYAEGLLDAEKITDLNHKLSFYIEGDIGYTLTKDTVIQGDFTLLAGTMDLNGYKLTVTGNLLQRGGMIDVNTGTLQVYGNYTLGNPDTSGSYQGNRAVLYMDDEADYMCVEGDVVLAPELNLSSYLTAGTIEVKGNLTYNYTYWNQNHFDSTLRFLMSGKEKQIIRNTTNVDYFRLGTLDIQNTSAEGVVVADYLRIANPVIGSEKLHGTAGKTLYWSNGETPQFDSWEGDLTVGTAATLEKDLNVEGTLTVDNTLDVNGHHLTAAAITLNQTMDINGGIVQVKTNLTCGISYYHNPRIIMQTESDILQITGNLTASRGTFTLTAGQLDVKGNVSLTGASVTAGDSHTTTLSGKMTSRGTAYIQTVTIPESVTLNTLVLTKPRSYYAFSRDVEGMCRELVEDIQDITAPSVPGGLSASDIGYVTVKLSWQAATDDTGVAGYDIYRDEKKIMSVSGTSYTDKNLTPGKEYSYYVIAKDATLNTSAASKTLTVATLEDTEAPEIPQAPELTERMGTALKLAWTETSDNVQTTGYRIYRDGEEIATTSRTEYLDTGLTANTRYIYTITAYDDCGNESEQSGEGDFYTQAVEIAEMLPADYAKLSGSKPSLQVSFYNTGSSAGYQVYMGYREKGQDDYTRILSKTAGTGTAYRKQITVAAALDTADIQSEEIEVLVRITDAGGYETEEHYTYYLDRSAPEKLSETGGEVKDGVAVISYAKGTDADIAGYYIYREEAGKDREQIADITDTAKTYYYDKTVENGVTYTYYVAAYDEEGYVGELSDAIVLTGDRDESAPVIESVEPVEGILSGTAGIIIQASDNKALDKVIIEAYDRDEGAYRLLAECSIGQGKAVYELDTTKYKDEVALRFTVLDGAGNENDPEFTKTYEIDNEGPEQIRNLTAAITSTTAVLTWDAPADDDFSYFLIEEQKEDGTWQETARTTTVTGCAVEGLEPHSSHTYRVTGYDIRGNAGEPSEPLTITIEEDTIAPRITAVSPNGGYYRDVIPLAVTAYDNIALSAIIMEASTDQSSWEEIARVTLEEPEKTHTVTCDYPLDGAAEGDLYIRAYAIDAAGNTGDAGQILVQYKVDKTAPSAVAKLTAEGEAGSIHLSWNEPVENDVAYYRIYRSPEGLNSYTCIAGNVTTLGYYDRSAAYDTSYSYRMTAVDHAGNESGYSNVAVAQKLPDDEAPVVYSLVPEADSWISGEYELSVYLADNDRLSSVEFALKENEENATKITVETVKTDISSGTVTCKLDTTVYENGVYQILVTAKDAAGNSSKTYSSLCHICNVAMETPELYAGAGNWCTNLHYPGKEDESYILYKKELSQDSFAILASGTGSLMYQDNDVDPDHTYVYQLRVQDKAGNAVSSVLSYVKPNPVDDRKPNAVLLADTSVVEGYEAVFNGLDSTDNDRIAAYTWDFGDGSEAVNGPAPTHTYKKAGEYNVTLTVADPAGNTDESTVKVTVLPKNSAGSAVIEVRNAAGTPLKGVTVYVNSSAEHNDTSYTDKNGKATVMQKPGTYRVALYKPGYVAAEVSVEIELHGEREYVFTLAEGETVTADFTVRQLTFEEIVDAGIDITDPANQHVFTVETKLGFAEASRSGTSIMLPADPVVSSGGGSGSAGNSSGGGSNSNGPGNGGSKPSEEEDELEKELDFLYYMHITQSISWLKDMYEATLIVYNNADSQTIVARDLTTKLVLPSGISLAGTSTGQSAEKELADLRGGESDSVTWYLRGDTPGKYKLNALLTGKLQPFDADLSCSFESNEFDVTAGDGLVLTIQPEDRAEKGESYYVYFTLTNEGSKEFYNLKTTFGTQFANSKRFAATGDGSKQVPVMSSGDGVIVDCLKPGESISGIYKTGVPVSGEKWYSYRALVDYEYKVLEGANLGVTVRISPVASHVPVPDLTYQPSTDENSEADPVNVSTGAYTDQITALSVQGVNPVSADLQYDSTATEELGEFGYGWTHNYEARIVDMKDGTVRYYVSPTGYYTFLAEDYEKAEYKVDDNGYYYLDAGTIPTKQDFKCLNENKAGYVLKRNSSGTFTLTDDAETVTQFDKSGNLTSIRNKDGKKLTITRSSTGFTVKDAASGRKLVYTLNDDKLVEKVTDGNGREVSFYYNEDKCLKQFTNAVGESTYYTYDKEHRILTVTDDNGNTYVTNTYKEYDSASAASGKATRVASQKDGLGNVTKFSYEEDEGSGKLVATTTTRSGAKKKTITDAYGNITCTTNEAGDETLMTYDEDGNETGISNANGYSTVYKYDSDGNMTSIENSLMDGSMAETVMTYDGDGNMLTMQNCNGESMRCTYYDNGLIATVTDQNGNTTRYTYNDNGQVTEEKDAEEKTIRYDYNAKGDLVKVTDKNGNVTEYTYNEMGLQETTTVKDGDQTYTTQTFYDDMGRTDYVIDTEGGVTSYEYDCAGSIISRTDPGGAMTVYQYDANYQMIKETVYSSEDGKTATSVTDYAYTKEGLLKTVTDGDSGTVITNTYDKVGNKTKEAEKNKEGKKLSEVRYEYDKAGNVTKQTQVNVSPKEGEPEGLSVQYKYYPNGKLNYAIDTAGKKTTYSYDSSWRVQTVVSDTEPAVTYKYDAAGNVLSMTEGSKSDELVTTTYTYDIYGNVVTATDGAGNVTTYSYDGNGNLTETMDAAHRVFYSRYDVLNRVTETGMRAPGENTTDIPLTRTAYDISSHTVTETDVVNGGSITTFYDAAGRPERTVNGDGAVLSETVYDSGGRILQTVDAKGMVTENVYNSLWQIEKVRTGEKGTQKADGTYAITGETRETAYTYDDLGRNTKVTDAKDGVSSVVFDGLGRIQSLSDPNQNAGLSGKNPTYAYTYDEKTGMLLSETNAIGNTTQYAYNSDLLLEEMTDSAGEKTAYTYDSLNRLKKVKDGLGTIEYTYDANGNITEVRETENAFQEVTGGGKTIRREFDSLNRVKKYVDYKGREVSYGYDTLGNLVALTYPGGEIVSYEYYDDGSVRSMTSKSGGTIYTWEYTYDQYGRLKNILRPDGSEEERTYDEAGNLLKQVDKNGDTVLQENIYTYNVFGEVISKSTASGADLSRLTTVEMTYNAANRLETYNGQRVTYDEKGNMTYGPVDGTMQELTYDCRNRLIEAGGVTYTYDAENTRIAATKDGRTTEYVTNTGGSMSQLLTAYEADGTETRYFYGAEGLAGQYNTGTKQYLGYHYDNIGSTTMVTDIAGKIVEQFAYGTYGELLTTVKNKIRFLYNGSYGVTTDENGLYYMRARYYNPDIKRFINQDIKVGDIGSGQSLNRYAYCEGNPVSLVDPFGLSPESTQDQGEKSKYQFWHNVLDVAGLFFDGADIINAGLYALEGNWVQAGVSIACALPFIGTAVAGVTKATKLVKIGKAIEKTMKIAGKAYMTVQAATTALEMAGDARMEYALNGGKITLGVAAKAAGAVFMGGVAALSAGSLIKDVTSLSKAGNIEFNTKSQQTADAESGRCAKGEGIGCFIAGTKVRTEDGEKNIEEVETGDYVLAENPLTGEQEYKQVVQTYIHEKTTLVHVFIEDEEVITTEEHPFYVEDIGFVSAGELRCGDTVRLADGRKVPVKQVRFEYLDEPVAVYNFEVEDFHTYYVSELGVLVHNMCGEKATGATGGGKVASGSGTPSRYDRTGYQSTGRSNNLLGRDRSTRRTTKLTEWRRSISKQNIHDEMRLFLGDDYVKVDAGKWRSLDGTRQFRVKPDDYLGSHGIGQPTVPNTPHVHFEFLVPRSNGNGFDVIKNIHVPISD